MLSDAAHMLLDNVAIGIGLAAATVAARNTRPADRLYADRCVAHTPRGVWCPAQASYSEICRQDLRPEKPTCEICPRVPTDENRARLLASRLVTDPCMRNHDGRALAQYYYSLCVQGT